MEERVELNLEPEGETQPVEPPPPTPPASEQKLKADVKECDD